mmetsp:Transcript_55518/g.118250  ORF Transcript_55518/g.118250 Transcript_55518/m.118250 type:complete len:423 (-) Transcript_55518:73-1341(-)
MDDFPDVVEEVAELVREDFLGWPEVARAGDVVVRHRPAYSDDGFICLQTTTVKPAAEIPRLEDVELIRHSQPDIVGGQVLKIFSPGDILFELLVKMTMRVHFFCLMAGSKRSESSDVEEQLADEKTIVPAIVRAHRRHGHPSPDAILHVSGPVIRRQEPYESEGALGALAYRQKIGRPCLAAVWEPAGPDLVYTHDFVFMPMDRRWMIPTIARAMALSSSSSEPALPISRPPPEAETPWYVVLRLKKCSRGPPLIPISAQDAASHDAGNTMCFNGDFWTPCVRERSFTLSMLIKQIIVSSSMPLEDLDFEDSIFDTLDGRRFVYFECAVRSSMWKIVESTVMEYFSKQAPAYRHWYGGRSAPSLQANREPIFVENEFALPCYLDEDFEAWRSFEKKPDKEALWPCKNTFIHFDEAPLVESMA